MRTEEEEDIGSKSKGKPWLKRIGRGLLYLASSIILLLIVLILLIRIPGVQQWITDKATDYITAETGAHCSIDRLLLTFKGRLWLEGVYMEDLQKDTLLYSSGLELGIGIRPLFSNTVQLSHFDWNGLKANIHRNETGVFNFDFIIDAFTNEDAPVAEEENTGKDWKISLPHLHFRNFDISYIDQYEGMYLKAKWENILLNFDPFTTGMDSLNIQTLKIDGLESELVQHLPSEFLRTPKSEKIEEDSSSGVFPISIAQMNLNSIEFDYSDSLAGNYIAIIWGHQSLEGLVYRPAQSNIDLNELTVKKLESRDLSVSIINDKIESDPVSEELQSAEEQLEWAWPNWKINLAEVSFINHQLSLRNSRINPTPQVFNPDDIQLNIEEFLIPSLQLEKELFQLEIQSIVGKDHSGISIREFGLDLRVSDSELNLSEFEAKTQRSSITGNLQLGYPNFNTLLNNPMSASINMNIPALLFDPDDALYFSPELATDSIFGPLIPYPIRLKGKISGDSQMVLIEEFRGNFGKSSRLALRGIVTNPTEPDRLTYQLPHLSLFTSSSDMALFVPPDTSYRFPDHILVVGSANGGTTGATFDLSTTVPEGRFNLEGTLANIDRRPDYRIKLVVEALNSAHYTDSVGPEKLVGEVNLIGEGFEIGDISANLDGKFSLIQYRGKVLSPLEINSTVDGNAFQLDLSLNSELAILGFIGNGTLDSTAYQFKTAINVRLIDLKGMDLHERDLIVSTKVLAEGSGNQGVFDGKIRMSSLNAANSTNTYKMDSLVAQIYFDQNISMLDIQSELLSGNLTANATPEATINGLMAHLNSYWETEYTDSLLISGLEADVNIEIPETEFMKEVILPGLEAMDMARLEIKYRENTKSIFLDFNLPYVMYDGTEIEGLFAQIESDRTRLEYSTGLKNLRSGPADIKRTRLFGSFADSTLYTTLDLQADTLDQIILMSAKFKAKSDRFTCSIIPDSLVFNNDNWSISERNEITIATDYLDIQHFELSRGTNSLRISSHPGQRNNFLKVAFNQIDLGGLLTFINPEEEVAEGMIQGFVELDEIFDGPKITADLDIENLALLDINLGDMKTLVQNPSANFYELNTQVKGPNLDLDITGEMNIGGGQGFSYESEMNLAKMEFFLLEPFMEDQISDCKGILRGNVTASGSQNETNYEGFIRFDEVGFTVLETGSKFSIPAERVDFSQSDIVFNQFKITDNQGNPTNIDGNIGIESITKPVFDLNIKSRNFTFLESTRADNDFIFGKAIADLDIDLTGTLYRPSVNADLDLKSGSAITMIIPESEIDIEEREGVVKIERRIDGKVIPDESEEETAEPLFKGVDLEAIINIDPSVTLRIVIDERAGDQLEVAGEANLSFDMDADGRMSLSGIYELNRGFYEMRMYDIARRRFELQPGSRLVWSGDPLGAEMDIIAIYQTKTSALDLMANQLAGADESMRNQYRQELPFEVVLDVGGELLRPNLSFSLDMPEEARAELGGNVYNRIRQLNTMESELNTQVFALLVLNRFLSEGLASEETRGFDAGSMARSSASKILSGQLNSLSERYIRGVDLDFDLESFSDYQSGSPEERTQLSVRMRKSLLDDRLSVQVGGQVDIEGSENEERQGGSDILGDVSVEYRLTEDGSWSLKGFRKNQFEGMLEGQVIATGISLLFRRDFNTFAELFSRKEKKKDEEEDDND